MRPGWHVSVSGMSGSGSDDDDVNRTEFIFMHNCFLFVKDSKSIMNYYVYLCVLCAFLRVSKLCSVYSFYYITYYGNNAARTPTKTITAMNKLLCFFLFHFSFTFFLFQIRAHTRTQHFCILSMCECV